MPKSGRLARARQNGLADRFSKPIIPHLVATARTSIRRQLTGYRVPQSIAPPLPPPTAGHRGLDSPRVQQPAGVDIVSRGAVAGTGRIPFLPRRAN